jgi:hypothetical protein
VDRGGRAPFSGSEWRRIARGRAGPDRERVPLFTFLLGE